MAKGIPSSLIGRCFGISINSSPATTASIALRTVAEASGRCPLSQPLFSPSNLRFTHSQRQWQPFDRIAYSSAPASSLRHVVQSRQSVTKRTTPLTTRSSAHQPFRILTWPLTSWQQRFYSDSGSGNGNKSTCSCGKDITNISPTPVKTTQDLKKVEASTLYETTKDASSQAAQSGKPDSQGTPGTDSEPASYMSYLHLPKMPHRPTKEELLEAANGFWQRLKVRLKWVSIRSMRPWNIDEWGAFVSWFLFGHLLWILVGTTTFFSLIILSINTVVAQETLAQWVGDYLTQSAGVTVVFESAIVPKWRDNVISFRNVFVSRRPGQGNVSSVSKGSSDAAAEAAAGRKADLEASEIEDDGNYTQFDVTLSTVNVTLSFLNWWNGKGLLKDVEIKGVRGVIDRTSVTWPVEEIDPLSYRHKHQPGDFEIEKFKMEDLLLTVHQPGGFRPFSVSIFSCELPQLRKQWLFYDFLSANHMSGSFDGSLFTIHPRQVHGVVPSGNGDPEASVGFGDPKAWKKFSRLRIDGLKIDHLNRGVEGPFGWIYEGNVDIVSDVMFPADTDESITKVMADFYDQLEEIVDTNRHRFMRNIQEQGPALLTSGHLSDSAGDIHDDQPVDESQTGEDERRYLIMDLRISMNDVKAAVPIFTKDMSYVNQALVRPIVAYINAKKTYIPINCRIVKRASDFDGSWSIFDCGLMNDMSAETYDAFASDVENQQSRVRRFKKVGFWTLSLAVHALFMGMAGNVV
ncbi:Mitochondrial distribution and morphology protein 31, mitochondrial precursor [Fusarium torreyae]|uniref:Mitochondrial distribution and morphology protein 31, mitochondrial n=1 Tax=Fusarium torreyae TaxID=1237075 RepID=A0A9W8SHQ0_9HYPO|nr:Mitochondrial distribution and morphology protein 31, mitochondrial precursor [Fusarium torreyae]